MTNLALPQFEDLDNDRKLDLAAGLADTPKHNAIEWLALHHWLFTLGEFITGRGWHHTRQLRSVRC